METEGRCLTQEKIFFRDTSVLAGANADWGRDSVNNTVISAVSDVILISWQCCYHINNFTGGLTILAIGVYQT